MAKKPKAVGSWNFWQLFGTIMLGLAVFGLFLGLFIKEMGNDIQSKIRGMFSGRS